MGTRNPLGDYREVSWQDSSINPDNNHHFNEVKDESIYVLEGTLIVKDKEATILEQGD